MRNKLVRRERRRDDADADTDADVEGEDEDEDEEEGGRQGRNEKRKAGTQSHLAY